MDSMKAKIKRSFKALKSEIKGLQNELDDMIKNHDRLSSEFAELIRSKTSLRPIKDATKRKKVLKKTVRKRIVRKKSA